MQLITTSNLVACESTAEKISVSVINIKVSYRINIKRTFNHKKWNWSCINNRSWIIIKYNKDTWILIVKKPWFYFGFEFKKVTKRIEYEITLFLKSIQFQYNVRRVPKLAVKAIKTRVRARDIATGGIVKIRKWIYSIISNKWQKKVIPTSP